MHEVDTMTYPVGITLVERSQCKVGLKEFLHFLADGGQQLLKY